ncbi:hypothetical protein D918_00405 [Trichuris suis]|nr:hypothetical protein D918_00405 [Trichuris suis]
MTLQAFPYPLSYDTLNVAPPRRHRHKGKLRAKEKVNKIMNAVKLTEDEEKRYDSLKGSYDHKVEKCIKENCTHQPSKENGGIFKADDDPSARNVKECSSTCHREARHDFTELWKLSDKRDCYELMRDYMELDNPKEAIKIYMLYKKHYFCNEVSLVTGGCDFPEP